MLLQAGHGKAADLKGGFLAAEAAGAPYRLLGKAALLVKLAVAEPIMGETIHQMNGGARRSPTTETTSPTLGWQKSPNSRAIA